MIIKNIFEKVHEQFYFVFRVLVGLMLCLHGAQKFGIFGNMTVPGFAGAMGLPIALAYAVATIELIGGLAILLGLYTRLAALLGSFVMIGALVLAHFPQGLNPLTNKGELAIMYLVSFLVILIYGAGVYALEKAFSKKELF